MIHRNECPNPYTLFTKSDKYLLMMEQEQILLKGRSNPDEHPTLIASHESRKWSSYFHINYI